MGQRYTALRRPPDSSVAFDNDLQIAAAKDTGVPPVDTETTVPVQRCMHTPEGLRQGPGTARFVAAAGHTDLGSLGRDKQHSQEGLGENIPNPVKKT